MEIEVLNKKFILKTCMIASTLIIMPCLISAIKEKEMFDLQHQRLLFAMLHPCFVVFETVTQCGA